MIHLSLRLSNTRPSRCDFRFQVYYVQQADRDGLEVTLAGRQFTLSKGAFMHVPPGAAFKIRNLSDDRAAKMIFFIVMVRV